MSAREVAKESGFNIEKVVLIDVVVLSVRRKYCVQDSTYSTVKYLRADHDDNELAKKILRFRKWNRNPCGPVGRVVTEVVVNAKEQIDSETWESETLIQVVLAYTVVRVP